MRERKKDSAKCWKGLGNILSHFVKVKTKITNRVILEKALERMSLNFRGGNDLTINVEQRLEEVAIKFDNAIGLSLQEDGTYAIVGDPYYSKNKKLKSYYNKNKKFATDLSTAYAIEEAVVRLEEQQFYCSENAEGNVGEDGMITMVFENWG